MKVIEYWPNFVEKSEAPRVVDIASLDELSKIPWLNKSGHGYRVDGRFIRQYDSDIIIAIIGD